MSWLVGVLGAILFLELFVRLPVLSTCRALAATGRKAAATLRSRHISDHWKEEVLRHYALLIGGRSLALCALILLCVLPAALLAVAADAFGLAASATLSSWSGLAVCTAAGTAYAIARARLVRSHAAK